MKKLLIIALLIAMAVPCYAATKATQASMDKGISGGVVGIGDLSSGDTAEVNSYGSLQAEGKAKSVLPSVSDPSNAIITGACTVYGFITKGVSAGDYALVYDALTVTGDPKFDIYVGTAADTKVVTLPAGGVAFTTGVTIDSTDGDVVTSVIYLQ